MCFRATRLTSNAVTSSFPSTMGCMSATQKLSDAHIVAEKETTQLKRIQRCVWKHTHVHAVNDG